MQTVAFSEGSEESSSEGRFPETESTLVLEAGGRVHLLTRRSRLAWDKSRGRALGDDAGTGRAPPMRRSRASMAASRMPRACRGGEAEGVGVAWQAGARESQSLGFDCALECGGNVMGLERLVVAVAAGRSIVGAAR